MKIKKDVTIVGAGPAGLATAIQLNRFNISCVIVEKNSIGGLLKNANQVENYLGFPEGITGNSLINLFKKQLSKNNIQIIFEQATKVDFQDGKFFITTENYNIKNEFAVIATGTTPKKIKNLAENTEIQSRIVYEVNKIQNSESKKIAIIGAGDAAFDYALNLSGQNNVTIFNRKDKEKCLPVLKKRIEVNQNIQYFKNRTLEIVKFVNDKLELRFLYTENAEIYYFDYLLIAIGREPELSLLGKKIKVKMDFLVADKKLFFIGDVKNKHYRQLSIATGDGVRAAMEINEALIRTKN